MPNISFDIFFNDDTLNFTASRSQGAPKVKPAWKVRSAPKLQPSVPKTPGTAGFAKPSPRIEELPDSRPTSPAPKKAIPKLKDQTKGPSTPAPKKNIPKLNTTPKAPTAAAPKKDIPKLGKPAAATKAPPKLNKAPGKAPAQEEEHRENRFART